MRPFFWASLFILAIPLFAVIYFFMRHEFIHSNISKEPIFINEYYKISQVIEESVRDNIVSYVHLENERYVNAYFDNKLNLISGDVAAATLDRALSITKHFVTLDLPDTFFEMLPEIPLGPELKSSSRGQTTQTEGVSAVLIEDPLELYRALHTDIELSELGIVNPEIYIGFFRNNNGRYAYIDSIKVNMIYAEGSSANIVFQYASINYEEYGVLSEIYLDTCVKPAEPFVTRTEEAQWQANCAAAQSLLAATEHATRSKAAIETEAVELKVRTRGRLSDIAFGERLAADKDFIVYPSCLGESPVSMICGTLLKEMIGQTASSGEVVIANLENQGTYVGLTSSLANVVYAHNGIDLNSSRAFFRMLYFSTVTITTLGYGDIAPVTTNARLIVSFQSILGIVLAGLFLNSIAISNNSANRDFSEDR